MKGPSVNRRRLITGGLATAALHARPASALSWSNGGAVCYLDPLGDDSADGRSPATAWRTLAALAQADARLPLEVRMRRGGIWREPLVAPQGPVRIAAYGHGAAPVIDVGRPLGPVRLAGRVPQGQVWSADLAYAPRQVLCEGRHMRRVAYRHLDRVGRWTWGDGILRVATPGSAYPQLGTVHHERGIDGRHCERLALSGIVVRHAVFGLDVDDTPDCIVEHAAFSGCYLAGIRASSAAMRHRLVVRDCSVEETGGTAIAFGGRIGSVALQHNLIRRSGCVADVEGEPSLAWTAAIKNWGWAEAGWQGHVVISDNRIEECGPRDADRARPEHGHGIWIDEVVEPRARHLVAFNRVSRCASRGIYVEKSDSVDVDYNALHHCGQTATTGGLALQANRYGYDVAADAPALSPGRCRWNKLRHNTVAGDGLALEVVSTQPGCDLSDNLISDNIFLRLRGNREEGAAIRCIGGGANDGRHGGSNRYIGNCLGPEAGRKVTWGHRKTGSIARLAKISHGAFDRSLGRDPALVNAAAGDFRLRAHSPCLNAATGLPRMRDIDGQPVPQGPAADIGCHEGIAHPSTFHHGD